MNILALTPNAHASEIMDIFRKHADANTITSNPSGEHSELTLFTGVPPDDSSHVNLRLALEEFNEQHGQCVLLTYL